MERVNRLLSDCRQVMDFLAGGMVEEAVRLSGETLAAADKLWTVAFNGQRDSATELDVLLQAAYAHIESLAVAGETDQAFSTCLVTLYASVLDRSDSVSLTRGRLTLWVLCMQLFQQLLHRLDASDADTVEHVRIVTGYVASMLYASYSKARDVGIEGPMMEDAYVMLDRLRGVIQTPCVTVDGDCVIPAGDARPLMADLTGRCRAIGIFNV